MGAHVPRPNGTLSVIPRSLRQGSLASIVCRILYNRRRHGPTPVAKLSLTAHADPQLVSNALQRLKRLGAVRLTTRGWTYRKQDRG